MNNNKFKELDAIGEDKLWEKFIKSSDQEIRDYFVVKYAPLVKYVAGKISMGMPSNIEFDDLVSYGIFGLIDAITKFDPARGIKFKTYAMTRIRGAIFDELRSIDWIPRSIRQKAKQVELVIIRAGEQAGAHRRGRGDRAGARRFDRRIPGASLETLRHVDALPQ